MDRRIDQLQVEMSNLETLIAKFPKDKREEKLFDKWSLRDVVTHINAWNSNRVVEIRNLIKGLEIKRIDDYDGFNYEAILSKKEKRYSTYHGGTS